MNIVTDYQCSQAEHRPWFELIQNKENWKLPIEAVIPSRYFTQFDRAARFFTGGGLVVEHTHKNGLITVRGKGYYHYIGA